MSKLLLLTDAELDKVRDAVLVQTVIHKHKRSWVSLLDKVDNVIEGPAAHPDDMVAIMDSHVRFLTRLGDALEPIAKGTLTADIGVCVRALTNMADELRGQQ